jgi:surfactin family lipopeptide synthetase C/lichenysin synthetase C
VSAVRLTPRVFRQLVTLLAQDGCRDAEVNPVLFPSLRVVELLGEPVPAECVHLFQRHFPPNGTLINFLGSKEVLDYRIFYMDHETRIAGAWVPAGYALADTRVLLLDEAGKPLKTGSVGEIAVVSRSMSPGYWRRADLTNDRFACYSTAGNSRFYRTGDLGQLLPDGCLIYLGRRDSMVKIRGHRVEVDVLERSLRTLDGVADVAAVVAPTARQDLELVAFIVASVGPRPDERYLRRELGKSLPDFMMPSAFVFLEALPTTAMGKTDRKCLRSLARVALPQLAPSQLPYAPIETEIATIWAKILSRSQVGVDENFFELGGNSLMVMQVGFMLQRRFEIDLPLTVLFERPTVTGLAAYVREVLPVAQEQAMGLSR